MTTSYFSLFFHITIDRQHYIYMIMKHVFDVLQKDKTPEDYEEFSDKELWLEKEIVVCNVQFILKLSSANFLADINCLNDFCVIYI